MGEVSKDAVKCSVSGCPNTATKEVREYPEDVTVIYHYCEQHNPIRTTDVGEAIKLDGDTGFCTLLRCPACKAIIESDVLPQEPAGRELPDGPGFWQRYGEKWVIRQHTESMFFGCLCDTKGYLGRTVAVLPKGGWRRADAGDASELREEVERLKDIEAYLNARLCELSREYNNYQITSNTKYDALQAQYDALLEGSE